MPRITDNLRQHIKTRSSTKKRGSWFNPTTHSFPNATSPYLWAMSDVLGLVIIAMIVVISLYAIYRISGNFKD